MKNSDISLKKLPPHSDEAEKSVLGSVLFDNDALGKIVNLVKPEDFFQPANRKIMTRMLYMFDRNERIDLVTLSDALLKSGDLEIIGGPPYLMDLMEVTPTATAIVSHARIVKEKSILRRLIAVTTMINLEAYGERVEVENLLSAASKVFDEIQVETASQDKLWEKLGDSLPGVFSEIEVLCDPDVGDEQKRGHAIPTGFGDLDDLIIGLFDSDLIILAARPSMGKTSFGFGLGANIAKKGLPVAVFSIETARNSAVLRFLCSEAKVDSHSIRSGNLDNSSWPKLTNGVGVLAEIPLYICDCPGITLDRLRIEAKLMVKKHGIRLIVIDYLQLINVSGKRRGRVEEVSEISRGLKTLQRELGIPVVVLSQLNRDVESRKPPRPMPSDLRGSGAIEQDADMVIMLYRHSHYVKKMEQYGGEDLSTEIIIAKNRNGKTGTVKMVFLKKYTRFEDVGREF